MKEKKKGTEKKRKEPTPGETGEGLEALEPEKLGLQIQISGDSQLQFPKAFYFVLFQIDDQK